MDAKRLTEWLSTARGLGTAMVALIGVPTTIWVAVTKAFEPTVKTLGLWPWLPSAAAAGITIVFLVLLWSSFKHFVKASRLERHDAFALRPTDPESLVGRKEEIKSLLDIVKRNRLVLLDGESGCGKSALVSVGLVSQLNLSDGLLPLVVRDWGDHWIRSPLSATLDALYHSVSQIDRNRLQWTSSPDLAADTVTLAADLGTRLDAVFSVLDRRPLLIADQFDDHQARHRSCFLDEQGSWLTPSALARSNPFWELVRAGLIKSRLHLLVVTRADTAAGLACVRFLGEDQTSTRTLPRVETEYLRPLLANIAPDDVQPPVVSNPTGGWHELREQLERDLKSEGLILMQQVRIVLLGLRQLPLLTRSRYRSAGGLRGVETLVISRALRQASDSIGGSEAGLYIARAILGKLILPAGPSQPPKAQRADFSVLSSVAGNPARAEAILKVLQREEVVRPAETASSEQAWQLDHDYLARAVLAEARQADRWAVALSEGKARYDEAVGDWRRRWAALLPMGTLARLYWERARKRLRFGEAASYAQASAIRPAILLMILALTGIVVQDQLLTAEASRLVDQLGSSSEADAVLTLWRAKEPLRQRVYDLVHADKGRLDRAVKSRWPIAHAGFEAARISEAAMVLRTRLEQERNANIASDLVHAYKAVAARMNDAAGPKAETMALRARLEQERDSSIAGRLASAYAAVAARMNDAADLKAEATALRARLEQERDASIANSLANAYEAVAARMNDAPGLKAEATALRVSLVQERDAGIASSLANAYEAVVARMNDAVDLKAEATALRARLVQERDASIARSLADAYKAVAARMNDVVDFEAEATALRARLEQERDVKIASSLARVYAAVAARINDAAGLKAAAKVFRSRLEQERDADTVWGLAQTYAAVAAQMNDAVDLKAEATALRARLEQERNGNIASSLADAYAAVAARMNDAADLKAEAIVLRTRLEQERDGNIASSLAQAYTAVAAQMNDEADLKAEAMVLRARLEQERHTFFAMILAGTYVALAAQMKDAAALKVEATALRARLKQERDDSIARSLAQAYAAVAAQMNDAVGLKAAATILRKQLEQEGTDFIASSLLQAYKAVAVRMNDAADLKAEATALRARLEQERNDNIASRWADAYMSVAARMNNAADLKAEATILRARLEQERDNSIASSLAKTYAAVAARMNDAADLKTAAAVLRARLEQEWDTSIVSTLADAYADVAMVILKRSDVQSSPALVREILTVAGYPFINDSESLIAKLSSLPEAGFGSNVGVAVNWAMKKHGVRPQELRPSPIDKEKVHAKPSEIDIHNDLAKKY